MNWTERSKFFRKVSELLQDYTQMQPGRQIVGYVTKHSVARTLTEKTNSLFLSSRHNEQTCPTVWITYFLVGQRETLRVSLLILIPLSPKMSKSILLGKAPLLDSRSSSNLLSVQPGHFKSFYFSWCHISTLQINYRSDLCIHRITFAIEIGSNQGDALSPCTISLSVNVHFRQLFLFAGVAFPWSV